MLETAKQLKNNKLTGVPNRNHEGKTMLLFRENSTRTRCAFVTGARDLGMHAEFLGKDDIQLGKKESVRDTALVLGRMFDGIEFRGFAHEPSKNSPVCRCTSLEWPHRQIPPNSGSCRYAHHQRTRWQPPRHLSCLCW